MNIERSSKAEFKAGTDTVGTTAQAAGLGFEAAKSILVKASAGNTDKVYVGHDVNVSSTNGFELSAGESVEIPVDSLAKVYVVGGAASQVYSWVAA